MKSKKTLKSSYLETPHGCMLAVGDEKELYLLEFIERKGLDREIEQLKKKAQVSIEPGITEPIRSIEKELKEYFEGKLKEFKTPIHILGTPFQKLVWNELQKIPYGQTRSYAEMAQAIGKPSAFRAVALANSLNQLAIIIPCHRVINSNGELGGYAGGISKKKSLLSHENVKF